MSPRILIVKLGALGDAVMASTLVGAARDRWPLAHITWVAGTSVAPLARLFEGVDRVIEIDDRRLLRGGLMAGGAELLRAWRAIGRGYDVAFLGHSDARYVALTAGCGARDVRRVPLGRGGVRGVWHGAVYAALAGTEITPPRYATLRPLPSQSFTGAADDAHTVVIAPGGARNVLRDDALRRWPIEHWVELTRRLVDARLSVVAVGAPHDADEGARCAAVGARDLTGGTDVARLLALLQHAACVVTHDSGVMHLALLARSPVVALFGPTRPEERIPPQAAAVTVLTSVAGLSCAPCYDGVGYAKCSNNRCVNRVTPAAVEEAVHRTMGTRADRG